MFQKGINFRNRVMAKHYKVVYKKGQNLVLNSMERSFKVLRLPTLRSRLCFKVVGDSDTPTFVLRNRQSLFLWL